MIFNMTSGGNTEDILNFKVVGGTTQPSSPSNNTIWVNTSTTITSWTFSVTQPTGAEGMVWIKTEEFLVAEFNAIKENAIQVYPMSAKQYVSGSWVTKTAKSYINNAWTEWTTSMYIYKNGSVLNGAGSVVTVGNASNNSTTISGSSNNQATSGFSFSNKVEIKSYHTTLKVKLSQSDIYGAAYFTFGIGTSNSLVIYYDSVNNMMSAKKQVSSTGSNMTVSLDISAYAGQSMYVIGNGISAYSVSEIWFE